MSNKSNEKEVTVNAKTTTLSLSTPAPTTSYTMQFENWFEELKEKAEDGLEAWERGSDIPPRKVKHVITFFLTINTYIEDVSSEILKEHEEGLKALNRVTHEDKDIKDVQEDPSQYDREEAMKHLGVVDEEVEEAMEETRWIRNEIAHNIYGGIKREHIDEKFNKNDRDFDPSESVGKAMKVFDLLREIKSE